MFILIFKTKLYPLIINKIYIKFVFQDHSCQLTDEDKVFAKIFSHIISMTVQLKYLFIERFEWFLYIIQYVSICFVHKSQIYFNSSSFLIYILKSINLIRKSSKISFFQFSQFFDNQTNMQKNSYS